MILWEDVSQALIAKAGSTVENHTFAPNVPSKNARIMLQVEIIARFHIEAPRFDIADHAVKPNTKIDNRRVTMAYT